jgi:hypothetical protein
MVVTNADARRALEAAVVSQGGFFTASQALDAGYSYQGQKYHIGQKHWERVDRGIYRFSSWLDPPEADYARWDLWSGGRAVISHGTALAIHDPGLAAPARVVVTVPPGFRSANRAVRLFKRVLHGGDVERREWFKVTTVLRTLLDVAADAATQGEVDAAVADALGRGLVSHRDLVWRADEFGDRAALWIERTLSVAGVAREERSGGCGAADEFGREVAACLRTARC